MAKWKFPKLKVDDLLRLALVNAELDRSSYAEACGYDSEEGARAVDQARQFRDYRLKRWGRTVHEARMANSKTVSLEELIAQKGPDRGFGGAPLPPPIDNPHETELAPRKKKRRARPTGDERG